MVSSPPPHSGTSAGAPRAHELAASPPAYLRALSSGMLLVQASVAGQVLLPIWVLLLISMIGSMGNPSVYAWSDAAIVAGAVLVSSVGAVGWWRITERDRSLPSGGDRESLRVALRGLMLANGVLTVARDVLRTQQSPPAQAIDLVRTALIVVIIVQFFASMRYLGWIAERSSHAGLPELVLEARKRIVLYFTLGWLIIIGPLIGVIAYAGVLGECRRAVRADLATARALDALD